MRRASILAVHVALVAGPVSAQIPAELVRWIPFERHPDLFFEAQSEETGWGVRPGWLHCHWEGTWQASGEQRVTRVWATSTWNDPDLRLPPVMEELTYAAGPQGLALLRRRSITAELPDEITELPPGSWLLPLPIGVGRSWTTETASARSWARVASTEAASPNTLVTSEPCLLVETAAVERRTSGAIMAELSRTWWAPSLGPVRVEQAAGALPGADWNALRGAALAPLLASAETMRNRAVLTLVPPAARD